jgi:hypothetical protein
MQQLGRFLIVFGVTIAVLGVVLALAGRVPFLGRLPGDIHIERRGLSFYFPVVTCLLLSLALTLILNLFRK